MTPMMTKQEIRIMEDLLLYVQRDSFPLSVLEWGSGGSTVYFTKFLRDRSIPYQWYSIEYNKVWFKKVTEAIGGNGTNDTLVQLFDVGNTKLKQRNTPMDDYVGWASSLGIKFDLILVDGRKRRRCLLEAAKLLFPGGLVVLHDAQREYYHCSFSSFTYHKFLAHKLWVGAQDNLPILWDEARPAG